MKKIIVIFLICCISIVTIFSDQSISYSKEAMGFSLTNKLFYTYTKKAVEKNQPFMKENLSRELISYTKAPIEVNNLAVFSGEDEEISLQSTIDPTAELKMNLDIGQIIINSGNAGYFDELGDTLGLVKKEAVQKTAITHLKNLNLLPAKSELGLIDVQEIRLAVAEKNGTTKDYCKLQTFRLERMLDGIPVQGASRIIVRLAENGRLHSMIYSWMDVEKSNMRGSMPRFTSQKQILNEVEKRILSMDKSAKKFDIQTMELVMYDDGEKYIEPAIHVVANTAYNNLLETRPVDFYVPVLANSKAKFPFVVDAEVKAKIAMPEIDE